MSSKTEVKHKRRSSIFDRLFENLQHYPENESNTAVAQREPGHTNEQTGSRTSMKGITATKIKEQEPHSASDFKTGRYSSHHNHNLSRTSQNDFQYQKPTSVMPSARPRVFDVAEPIIEPPTPIEGGSLPFTESLQAGTLRKSHEPSHPLRPRPTDIVSLGTSDDRGRTRTSSVHNLTPLPAIVNQSHGNSRSSSAGSAYQYYHSDTGSSGGKASKRKSWLLRSKKNAHKDTSNAPRSWILGMDGGGTLYDTNMLTNAEKIPELWDDCGDVLVYLHPQTTEKGPSFKISAAVISASRQLIESAFGPSLISLARRGSYTMEEATRRSYVSTGSPASTYSESVYSRPSTSSSNHVVGGRLYFPGKPHGTSEEDEEYFVSVRNLFAFLTCQPLVATRSHPTIFSVFNMIAAHLSRFAFTNLDGSTFGEAASSSLTHFLEAYHLADMRHSREKTIEGLILGERMKCHDLYSEAFSLAVGRYDDILKLKSPLLKSVSAVTQSRLERGWIDLEQRKQAVDVRITNFYFPALFAGAGNSTTSDDAKVVRYSKWKTHFLTLRKYFMSYQKDLYGAWPPQARSKKNSFSHSGLHRVVLRNLYFDLCTLYDALVDQTSPTTRIRFEATDKSPSDTSSNSLSEDSVLISALRKLLDESDNSSPPVQPPIPFDVPKIPTIATLEPAFASKSPKSQYEAQNRSLKDYERQLILAKSQNIASRPNTPFLNWFFELEERETRGKSAAEMQEIRVGWWLFVYVVLQSLPMLCIDAPNLKYTQGVEFFLCIPAKGGVPWMDEQVKKNWYSVQGGGGGKVQLPSDVIEYGIEGVYRRSHAWVMSEIWLGNSVGGADREIEEWVMSPLTPGSGEHKFWNDDRSGSERSRSRGRGRAPSDYSGYDLSSPYHPTSDQTALDLWNKRTDTSEDPQYTDPSSLLYPPHYTLPYQQLEHPSWTPPEFSDANRNHRSSSSHAGSQASSRRPSPQPRVTIPQSRLTTSSPSENTNPKQVQKRETKGFDDILNDINVENGKDSRVFGKKTKEEKGAKDKGEKRRSFLLF